MKASSQLDHHHRMHPGLVWHVPHHFNIAEVCCRRWAQMPDVAHQAAIVEHMEGQAPIHHSYAQLQQAANALSHKLQDWGVQRGDRVALVLPQCFETAAVHIAVMQMGAVAMPLSQ